MLQPKLIESISNTFVAFVTCGWAHTIAVTIEGNILGFGTNTSGELAIGNSGLVNDYIKMPTLLSVPERMVGAACGANFTMLIGESNKVYASGKNTSGFVFSCSLFLILKLSANDFVDNSDWETQRIEHTGKLLKSWRTLKLPTSSFADSTHFSSPNAGKFSLLERTIVEKVVKDTPDK